MFKNLQIYRLPKSLGMSRESIMEQMAKTAFQPCGSLDLKRSGWTSPTKNGDLVHAVACHWLISLCVEEKILPASVVDQVVKERAEAIEEQQGSRPGRKQLKEIKAVVTDELLPRAFSTRRSITAWIDPINGWMAVNASTAAKAEEVLSALNKSVENFPLSLLRTEISPATAMAEWLASDCAPGGFTIDRDCELKANVEEKSSVRYAHHSLEMDEIKQHLSSGKQPVRLAMTWNDRMSFILTDKLEIKRVQFLDIIKEEAQAQAETAEELFDADFLLMADELAKFLPDLMGALGGEKNNND